MNDYRPLTLILFAALIASLPFAQDHVGAIRSSIVAITALVTYFLEGKRDTQIQALKTHLETLLQSKDSEIAALKSRVDSISLSMQLGGKR